MGPDVAASVLAHYTVRINSLIPLRNAGGFSGARLWRVVAKDGEWCLKAWPRLPSLESQLHRMHQWMMAARAAGLEFIPRVRCTSRGSSFVSLQGWTWDLTEWLPGEPITDFEAPDWAIMSACSALGQLHTVWKSGERDRGVAVAVQRRQKRLAQWTGEAQWKSVPHSSGCEEQHSLLREIADLLPRNPNRCMAQLAAMAQSEFPLHPCVGDVWRQHILFVGYEVRGIIDYGSARIDTPAVDLARLLGSLTCRMARFDVGLRAYRTICPLSADEEHLVYCLDAAGTLVAALNWLDWLGPMGRTFDDPHAVTSRLHWTLARLHQLRQEGWF